MFVSTGGMEFDKEKSTILLMHGSGLTHIVWYFHEQFYSTQGFNVLSVEYSNESLTTLTFLILPMVSDSKLIIASDAMLDEDPTSVGNFL